VDLAGVRIVEALESQAIVLMPPKAAPHRILSFQVQARCYPPLDHSEIMAGAAGTGRGRRKTPRAARTHRLNYFQMRPTGQRTLCGKSSIGSRAGRSVRDRSFQQGATSWLDDLIFRFRAKKALSSLPVPAPPCCRPWVRLRRSVPPLCAPNWPDRGRDRRRCVA